MQSTTEGHAPTRAGVGARGVTSSFPRPVPVDDQPDWELVVAGRHSALLQGTQPVLDAAVELLHQQLSGPFQHWTGGSGLPLPPRFHGALFLAHVDECSPAEQGMLLEWLQESDSPVQIISTTTRKLSDYVQDGDFRADLVLPAQHRSPRVDGPERRRALKLSR